MNNPYCCLLFSVLKILGPTPACAIAGHLGLVAPLCNVGTHLNLKIIFGKKV